MQIKNLSYLGFSFFNKIGPASYRKLEQYFPDLDAAFRASSSDLERAGLSSSTAAEFVAWRPSFDMERALDELEKEKISFMSWHDPSYPPLLSQISAPPAILYYKGTFKPAGNRLAVVGSRQTSAYAEKAISSLLKPVIKAGVEIVSGLALGVDAAAHRFTLEEGGITAAILGSGLNDKRIYPRGHRNLADRIVSRGGCLISEFPPDTPPYKQNFPQRNRIIAGLSQATLIIESKEKSGALITAGFALEQNREVLSVPGSIFSEFSSGPNRLIKSGAKVVTEPEDILEIFKLASPSPLGNERKNRAKRERIFRPDGPSQALIYGLLRKSTERSEKISVDEIVKITKLDTATVNSTLSMLELSGVAKCTEYGYDLT